MDIHFRPHHFLCALCFKGSGYTPAFIKNFTHIMQTLNAHPDTQITITNVTDSICAPCPHRRHHACETQDKIAALDAAHANALAIQTDQKLTWQEAKALIAEKISLPIFHEICTGCEWKSLGICEEVLQNFLKV